MATWNEILVETRGVKPSDLPEHTSPFDFVRRRYLARLAEVVGHPIVLYATAFLDVAKARGDVSIHIGDKEGFLEVTRGLPEGPLDVIIHSPGGTAEAAEAIVGLLRARFDPVRFIVPIAAKSAATMLALSGNEIVGDVATELGPIDPQFRMARADRVVNAPAYAIKKQFEKAENEIRQDPAKMTPWFPILSQYGPSLLVECDEQIALSKSLVGQWLRSYMFAGDPEADRKADDIASYLSDWGNFGSHSRAVGLDELEQRGAKIVRLSSDPALDDAVWSAWHATSLTLANTGAVKVFENDRGLAHIKTQEIRVLGPSPQGTTEQPAPSLPRRERRAPQQRKKPKRRKR